MQSLPGVRHQTHAVVLESIPADRQVKKVPKSSSRADAEASIASRRIKPVEETRRGETERDLGRKTVKQTERAERE